MGDMTRLTSRMDTTEAEIHKWNGEYQQQYDDAPHVQGQDFEGAPVLDSRTGPLSLPEQLPGVGGDGATHVSLPLVHTPQGERE
eukprot:5867506-Pyramimonas_sp.AAC.1